MGVNGTKIGALTPIPILKHSALTWLIFIRASSAQHSVERSFHKNLSRVSPVKKYLRRIIVVVFRKVRANRASSIYTIFFSLPVAAPNICTALRHIFSCGISEGRSGRRLGSVLVGGELKVDPKQSDWAWLAVPP
jgi:hypothetical protein